VRLRARERALGILLGILLGLAIVIAFVFFGSRSTIDAPSVSGQGQQGTAPSRTAPGSGQTSHP
jgi:hypothetical protein